ncbi:hypothetical protein CYMTET_11448 [Cymbomonas tetramitiformis]|uniref:Uncharacterized protein n=1 Tax=Cymbomonas tetramitiformis TaxID=36881 RepID=A0AAE0GMJ2_9CHLO|nr:hypothetical protein CYMTET_11448 [Cymbomonas tetramitiformis]
MVKEEIDGDVVSKRNLSSAFASAATPSTNPFADDYVVSSLANDVLAAILTHVTVDAAFDLVRRCEGDGQTAYSKLRAKVEPQLFGQLANSLSRLHKLKVDDIEDPVKQLGAFTDLKTSIARYGGERLDAHTVEVMVLAAAVDALPGSYSLVVTKMGEESKPTFDMLVKRCDFHFINILKGGSQQEATDSAAAAREVLKENDDKKKVVCATCAGNGHATDACWLTNPTKLEDYVKRFPKEETRIRAAVEKRRKELKVTEKAAAAVMTHDEVWNAEGHEEVLIACSAVSSAATPCTNPFADGYVVSSAATPCTNPFADDYVVSSSASDGASSSSAVSSASNGASALSSASSAASTVEMGAARRVLHFDSMATTSIFNDVSYFIDGTYVPDSPFNLISAVALEDTYDLYAMFMERELQSGDGTTRYELDENLCLSSVPTTTTVSLVNLADFFTKTLPEERLLVLRAVVLEANRAMDIQKWLLQYDNRLTVSERDPSVYFIDIPNVLVVQLNFFSDNVECITSSEEWKTAFL